MKRSLFPTTLTITSYIGKYVGLRIYQHSLVQLTIRLLNYDLCRTCQELSCMARGARLLWRQEPLWVRVSSFSRLHDHRLSHSAGLLWTSDQPDAETPTWQLTRNTHPCLRWYSKTLSQQPRLDCAVTVIRNVRILTKNLTTEKFQPTTINLLILFVGQS